MSQIAVDCWNLMEPNGSSILPQINQQLEVYVLSAIKFIRVVTENLGIGRKTISTINFIITNKQTCLYKNEINDSIKTTFYTGNSNS